MQAPGRRWTRGLTFALAALLGLLGAAVVPSAQARAEAGAPTSYVTEVPQGDTGYAEVDLQRAEGTKWKTVTKSKLGKAATTFKVKPKTKGTSAYRVHKPVNPTLTAADSGQVKFKTT